MLVLSTAQLESSLLQTIDYEQAIKLITQKQHEEARAILQRLAHEPLLQSAAQQGKFLQSKGGFLK
jgi:hypothetical protein